jgi:gliding motility-associated-like protein
MNTHIQHKVFFWISFILLFIQAQNEAFASHAQSADLTYECLGGSQYRIHLSLYRDCAGVAAPTTATIDISSASCGQNLTLTLNQVAGTGIEVTPICATMTTQCSGGSNPGVQEYKYAGVITLPVACADWVFGYTVCCRNAAIGTILNPAAENLYVEAHLDNLNFPCNNSPVFSNPPIPFVCVGQPYCFNNGSYDADGDSLSYTLIAPETGPGATVTYNSPYSAAQPVSSSPLVTFNGASGDMCMNPTALEVTVFAVLVEEWRGGEKVGSVMRDIQLRTITCTNNNPYVNGINNTGTYSLMACAGAPVMFTIDTYDADISQNVSITWNAGISTAGFSSSGGSRPVGTFSWTPTTADISSSSHCFTVTVTDDNCPYNGSQIYSFCITVTGLSISTTATDANCGASNGTAQVTVLAGTGPFSYSWDSGSLNDFQNGLGAGTYTVSVTGAGGCSSTATATVNNGPAPGNITISASNISCYGSSNGTATVTMSGGVGPYSYIWSTGSTSATISGLLPGIYYVSGITGNGCVTNDSVIITQPAAPLSYTMSHTNVSCYGMSDGSATAMPAGGTGPYNYSWNTSPVQTTASASSVVAGNYTVMITDANGCSAMGFASVTQPPALNANAMTVSDVSCYGYNDGFTTVGASGGAGSFSYAWNTVPAQYTQNATSLPAGTYAVTVTDATGCTATSSAVVTEPTALALSTAAFPLSCYGSDNGQTVVIPSGGVGSYSYQWLPTGGTGASATGLSPGTYTIYVTDGNGCAINSSLTVTEPAPLVLSATGNTTICLGQNTVISASASGGTGGYTYTWPGLGSGASQTVSPTVPSAYSVSATDANGCVSNSASVNINVTSLTAANLSVSGSTAICYGNFATIAASVSGNTGTVSVSWSHGLGSTYGPFVVYPVTTTTYSITVTDACGTSVMGTVPVTVHPLPVIDIAPQSATACGVVELTMTDHSTTNAGSLFHWYFGDGTQAYGPDPVHSYYTSGIYTVTLSVTSAFGCTNTATTTNTVVVNAPSKAEFTAEGKDGSILSPVFKFHNGSTNSASYYWTLGDGHSSNLFEPEHNYGHEGQYLVTLYTESSGGCKDSMSRLVEVRPVFTLYIPNAFTPNGDGTNDYFAPKGAEISKFKMMIFDRWGEMIFQTSDIGEGWDGKANGGDRIAENAVYVYKIQVRDFADNAHNYMGHVTLLSEE